MKLNLIFAPAIFVLFTIGFSACKSDVDTQKPLIDLKKPVDDAHFIPGDTIFFECQFSDNEALLSYKISIHFNADGHDHKSSLLTADEHEAWHFERSWDFEPGQVHALVSHGEIIIPELINGHEVEPGEYHLGVFCTDASRNESNLFIAIEIGGGENDQ